MGCVESISLIGWPKQGAHLGQRVEVCFHHDTRQMIRGTIVRHDATPPYRGIIRLDDGRFVLAAECQYALLPPTGEPE